MNDIINECILCYKKINNKEFPIIIQQALQRKYCESIEEDYYDKPINNILIRKRCRELTLFREYRIEIKNGSCIKRFYNINEFENKFFKIKRFYFENNYKPNIFLKKEFKIHYKFYYYKEKIVKGEDLHNDDTLDSETSDSSQSLSKLRTFLKSSIKYDTSIYKSIIKKKTYKVIKSKHLDTMNIIINMLSKDKKNTTKNKNFVKKKNEIKEIIKKSHSKKIIIKDIKKNRISTKFKSNKILNNKLNIDMIKLNINNKINSITNRQSITKKINLCTRKINSKVNFNTCRDNISRKKSIIKGINIPNNNIKGKKINLKKSYKSKRIINKSKIKMPNSLTILNFNLNEKIKNLNINFRKEKNNIKLNKIKNFSLDNNKYN